jgi:predicted transcriptional regulator
MKKHPEKLAVKHPDVLVPITTFTRKKSILESLVTYLKDTKNMRGTDIAKLLDKKPSTIWTVYNRAKKK